MSPSPNYWFDSKQNSVWCQIIGKIVNTIQIIPLYVLFRNVTDIDFLNLNKYRFLTFSSNTLRFLQKFLWEVFRYLVFLRFFNSKFFQNRRTSFFLSLLPVFFNVLKVLQNRRPRKMVPRGLREALSWALIVPR